MDLVISFDDTGSMSGVRREVRSKLTGLINELFTQDPNLRVGAIIHNDYCDRDVIQKLDLTNNKDTIVQFINRSSSMGGGDSDECYELALHEMRSMDWQSSDRVAVVIGDCNPHPVGYRLYLKEPNKIDWKVEVQGLTDIGVKTFSIQALYNRSSDYFYKTLAQIGHGVRLELAQFNHITQYILGILHQQQGTLDSYEESDPAFKSNMALKNMFAKLRGKEVSVVEDKALEVMSGYQALPVHTRTKITDFVTSHGLRYKAGRGFYQLVKKETVQAKKEIILVHKKTGETVPSQVEARTLLGLPIGVEADINPRSVKACSEYNVYIQSTSFNRQLDAGTTFLYELDKV